MPAASGPVESAVDHALRQPHRHAPRPARTRPPTRARGRAARRPGTTRSTSPMTSASSAFTWRPLQMSSFAPGRADEPRQPLRTTCARDDAEEDLGLPDPRRVGGDAQVARHRQLEPAAERDAVDGGDHGSRIAATASKAAPEVRADVACRLAVVELGDVGAGGERLPVAGDDDRLHGGIGGEPLGRLGQRASSMARDSAFSGGFWRVTRATPSARASTAMRSSATAREQYFAADRPEPGREHGPHRRHVPRRTCANSASPGGPSCGRPAPAAAQAAVAPRRLDLERALAPPGEPAPEHEHAERVVGVP